MVSTENLVNPVAVLTGPTASGKSALALEFALQANSDRGISIEIINADSLLFYRGLDIGTAKPSPEERARIPHHLIDICDPGEEFTAADFSRAALEKIRELQARNIRSLVVGGSGFYLKALLFGLWNAPKADPAVRERLEKLSNVELYSMLQNAYGSNPIPFSANNRYRVMRFLEIIEQTGKTPLQLESEMPPQPHEGFSLLVIDRNRSALLTRIQCRIHKMLEQGLLDEVRTLSEKYPDARQLQSVGYQQCQAFFSGNTPIGRKLAEGQAGLVDEIEIATRQLVKKQRTWFRSQKAAEFFELDQDRELLFERLWAIYDKIKK